MTSKHSSYKEPLIQYLVFLADTNLILSQRNSEWCGHGPVLEQDIAITNITLDLLGQARLFYQYAAELINKENPSANETEDTLAYHRLEREYKNLLLTELPKGDWAVTILRQFLYSVYQQLLYTELLNGKDKHLAAIAEKSLKETRYHVKWSSEWVLRLGDGTPESHARLENALLSLWMYTDEMFIAAAYEDKSITGITVTELKKEWLTRVSAILQEATLAVPSDDLFMQTGGKTGVHTEHMGYILADLQYLQRAYPDANW